VSTAVNSTTPARAIRSCRRTHPGTGRLSATLGMTHTAYASASRRANIMRPQPLCTCSRPACTTGPSPPARAFLTSASCVGWPSYCREGWKNPLACGAHGTVRAIALARLTRVSCGTCSGGQAVADYSYILRLERAQDNVVVIRSSRQNKYLYF